MPHHFKSNSSLFLTDFLTGGGVMFVKAVSVIFIRTVGISARKKKHESSSPRHFLILTFFAIPVKGDASRTPSHSSSRI